MKQKIKSTLYFILTISVLTFYSCEGIDQSNEATVAFDLKDGGFDTVRIFQVDLISGARFENQELVLDSLGTGSKSLSIPELKFFTMEVGKQSFPISILLQKDYDITIKGEKKDLLNTIEFEGRGSISNNFRIGVHRIDREFDKMDGKHFFQLDSAEFINRISTKNLAVSKYINNFTQKHTLPIDLQQMLINESKLITKAITLNYYLVNRKIQKPETIDIPWDTTLLNAGSPGYSVILSFYQDLEIINPLWNTYGAGLNDSGRDSLSYQFPQLVFNEIESSRKAAKIKEIMIARYLFFNHFRTFDITPVVDSVFIQWKEQYPNSEYLNTLENQLKQNQTLAPGTVAPEIMGVTPEGDSLYLSDLKGKVVYIDVWATWCGPCIKEFPYAKQLQDEFNNNKKVAFLYVSVDREVDKWQKYLSQNQLKGFHINSSDGNFSQRYRIAGIPRYIIVDQMGKIVKMKAPRPSSGKVKEEILTLLEHGS